MLAVLLAAAALAATTSQAVPVDFQQVGPGTPQPGGVLMFIYSWASSSGDLADLSNCRVGEFVLCPGPSGPNVRFDWPSPPYSGSTPNPTVLNVMGVDGEFSDFHKHQPFSGPPYAASSIEALQTYRYTCGGKYQRFPGWIHIHIDRKVYDKTGRGCYNYRVFKSGYQASVTPLPHVPHDDCTHITAEVASAKPSGSPDNVMASYSNDDIGVSVSLPENSLSLHAPIFLNLTLTNRGFKTANIALGLNNKANLKLLVHSPSGNVGVFMLTAGGIGKSGNISLASGEKFSERILLNEWDPFRLTGTYRVKLTLVDISGIGPDKPSAEFSVGVRPRASAELERASRDLAERAVAKGTFDERDEAANALSYILDPVAIDSLARLLQPGSMVERRAILGLGRIGGAKAISALGAAERNPDEEIRASALGEIKMLQSGMRESPTAPNIMD